MDILWLYIYSVIVWSPLLAQARAKGSTTNIQPGGSYKPVWKLIKGTSRQSSTYRNRGDMKPERALDKHFNTYSCTNKENYPYWYVEFKKPHFIRDVTFVNRRGCCVIRELAVLVDGKLCGRRYKGPTKRGEEVTIVCSPPIQGNDIKLESKHRSVLCFAEIEIIGARVHEGATPIFPPGDFKVVKGTKGKQKTTLGSPYIPIAALDGNVYTFSHTQKVQNPYFIVELPKIYQVKEVKIRKRVDAHPEIFQNVVVTVDGQLCNSYEGPGKQGDIVILTCNELLKGREVKIRKKDTGHLAMAEVKVIAAEVNPGGSTATQGSQEEANESRGTSEIVGTRTGQSSTYNTDKQSFESINAADGNLNTFSCTRGEYFPFWWVELGEIYLINAVNIIARKECCGVELRNVVITVDDNRCAVYKGPAKNGEKISQPCTQPIEGHQVKLMLNERKVVRLLMAEVKVIGTQAKTKREKKVMDFTLRSGQSTTHGGHSAYNALDRNPSSFSCTGSGHRQHWWVKFDAKEYSVKGVKILNRRSHDGGHLKRVEVKVDGKICGFFKGPALTGEEIFINCQKPIVGRKVQVEKNDPGPLCLAEVAVKIEI